MNNKAALVVVLAGVILASGCSLAVRVNPESVGSDQRATVTAKLTNFDEDSKEQEVVFKVVDGEECGRLQDLKVNTVNGIASNWFTGAKIVEKCHAVIQVTVGGSSAKASVVVNPPAVATARLDGISIIALVLIGSFAVDRIVRGLLFGLSYWKRWASLVPDPNDPATPVPRRKHHQLAYFCFAACLGVVALGWYGGVRILSALGFVAVNPILDTLITGLILVGGADRTEAILCTLGAGGAEAAGARDSAPIQITGTLVLEGNLGNELGKLESKEASAGSEG